MSDQKPIEVFIPIYKFKVGFLWIPFKPPAGTLSDLIIDVNKDWRGYVIKNLGAPVDPNDSLRLIDLINHRTSSPIDHPDGSITTAKIADGAITTAKIADGSVTRAKLSGVFPITTSDIADGSITTSKISDRAVTRAKIESPLTLSNVILEVLTSDPSLATGRIWYRSDLDRISYSPDGVNIRRIPPSPIGSSDIADGAITSAKIADAAVTSAKIADGSITTSKIADASITPPKIKSVTTPSDGYVLSYDGSSGLFKWTASAGGVTALSQLTIDVDKDWGGHVIKNLGTPVDPRDSLRLQDLTSHRTATPIDHPDRSVTRAKLEYPTADVSFAYLYAIDKAKQWGQYDWDMGGYYTVDSFTDKAIEFLVSDKGVYLSARSQGDEYRRYSISMDSGFSAADFRLDKYTGSKTATNLGYEAVDVGAGSVHVAKISCLGSTIKAYRVDMTTPKITVTDTTYSSGIFGAFTGWRKVIPPFLGAWLRPPSSPSPQPVAYFEVPVVGGSGPDDPFRAQMPELIEWEWSLNPLARKKYDILKARGFTDEEILTLFPEILSARVNRLALTHSSLIKTDKAGKPIDYVAIVRIFDQPDRQPHLHPIPKALDTLRSMKGVRRLSREEAIRRAKQLDPDLTDVDLLPVDPKSPRFRQALKDYIEHRKGLGVKEEMIDEKLMEQYLQEDKGW